MVAKVIRKLLALVISLLPKSNLRYRLIGAAHYFSPQIREDLYIVPGEALAYAGFYRSEYAIDLANKVGRKGYVVLMEADPRNYARLVKGLEYAANRERIHALHMALWQHQGQVPFEMYEGASLVEFNKIATSVGRASYPDSPSVVDVACDTFDNVARQFPEVSHLFVTINGAELGALKGMSEFLRKPGVSVWIKSPFRSKETGMPMYADVAEVLRRHGMKVIVAVKPEPDAENATGKVYAYQPL